MNQATPLHFFIVQAIKNWMVGRPGNEGIQFVFILQFALTTQKQKSSFCVFLLVQNKKSLGTWLHLGLGVGYTIQESRLLVVVATT